MYIYIYIYMYIFNYAAFILNFFIISSNLNEVYTRTMKFNTQNLD